MLTWWDKPLLFDLFITDKIESLRHPVLDSIFLAITYLGSPMAFIILGLGALIFLVYNRQVLEGVYLNLCLLVSWEAMHLLKNFFARPRPEGEHLTIATGMSFPSGHAMLSLVFYGFIGYLVLKNLSSASAQILTGLLFALLILMIGISRVYLNVHFPTDIVAGYLIGGLFLGAFIKLYEWHHKKIINR